MKVKIILDEGETPEEAREQLHKALEVSTAPADKELYADDLANKLLDAINEDVEDLFKKMYDEIGTIVAKDVFGSKNGF